MAHLRSSTSRLSHRKHHHHQYQIRRSVACEAGRSHRQPHIPLARPIHCDRYERRLSPRPVEIAQTIAKVGRLQPKRSEAPPALCQVSRPGSPSYRRRRPRVLITAQRPSRPSSTADSDHRTRHDHTPPSFVPAPPLVSPFAAHNAPFITVTYGRPLPPFYIASTQHGRPQANSRARHRLVCRRARSRCQ